MVYQTTKDGVCCTRSKDINRSLVVHVNVLLSKGCEIDFRFRSFVVRLIAQGVINTFADCTTLTESERLDNPAMKAINGAPEAGWPKKEAMNPVTIYRSAKTGLNMAVREWDRILRNDGVKVWAVSPGFLATGLGGVGPEQLKKVRYDSALPLLIEFGD